MKETIVNSRERVLAAINHKESDRVPIDVGGTGLTGINLMAYGRLKRHLGIKEGRARVYHSWLQLPELEEPVRNRLHVDTVTLPRHRMSLGIKNEEWKVREHVCGTEFLFPVDYNPIENEEGDWEWHENGQVIAKAPASGKHSFTLAKHPLSEIDSKEGIDRFFDEYSGNFTGRIHCDDDELAFAGKMAKDLYEKTDKCVISDFFGTVLENAQGIVGWDEIYARMLTDPDIAKYFLERLTEELLTALKRYLPVIKDYVQVMVFADDLGQQTAPMMRNEMYREFIKPFHSQLFQYVRNNSDIKVYLHSCGCIYPLIPDLIDAGVQILNPVQTNAAQMDPVNLKREFGKDVVFWGGGVDTQTVLDKASPAQIREDVRRRVEVLAPGGGWVWASIHNMVSSVQPESILAAIDTVHELGRYPIPSQDSKEMFKRYANYWTKPMEELEHVG